MTIAENLLFGTPIGDAFRAGQITDNAYVRQLLESQELMLPSAHVGRQIAETMVELFADLPAGHPFFEQFSFIDADDLPEFRNLLARIGKAWSRHERRRPLEADGGVHALYRRAPSSRPDRRCARGKES